MLPLNNPEEIIVFTVPYLHPPSVNHYKQPTRYVGRDGYQHLGFKLSKETKAYYEAVAIFARGRTVAPADAKKKKTRYSVKIDVYLGRGERGDEDNFAKAGVDCLVKCGVIHSDAYATSRIEVHRDERDNPRTQYTVTRLES